MFCKPVILKVNTQVFYLHEFRSSAVFWSIGKRPLIIWTQQCSEHCRFWPFYKGKWQFSLFSALRWCTTPIWMIPTPKIFYYIYLLLIDVNFTYCKLYVHLLPRYKYLVSGARSSVQFCQGTDHQSRVEHLGSEIHLKEISCWISFFLL